MTPLTRAVSDGLLTEAELQDCRSRHRWFATRVANGEVGLITAFVSSGTLSGVDAEAVDNVSSSESSILEMEVGLPTLFGGNPQSAEPRRVGVARRSSHIPDAGCRESPLQPRTQ